MTLPGNSSKFPSCRKKYTPSAYTFLLVSDDHLSCVADIPYCWISSACLSRYTLCSSLRSLHQRLVSVDCRPLDFLLVSVSGEPGRRLEGQRAWGQDIYFPSLNSSLLSSCNLSFSLSLPIGMGSNICVTCYLRISLSFLFMSSHFSHVWLFVTPWTVAFKASLSMGFSRQEYWSGLPCPLPGDLSYPGIKPVSLVSPALAGRFFTSSVFVHLAYVFITRAFVKLPWIILIWLWCLISSGTLLWIVFKDGEKGISHPTCSS